jgi:CMP-2-keto-3-deoxyoctulosonic acid synthetase
MRSGLIMRNRKLNKSSKDSAIVIPARIRSTRNFGKLLIQNVGKPKFLQLWESSAWVALAKNICPAIEGADIENWNN